MLTSVGWDAISACAAIRAGVTRPRPLDDFPVGSLDTMKETFPIGHPVIGQTDGFMMFGRWSRLIDGALSSLWTTSQVPGPDDERFFRTTALIAVLPRLNDARFGTADEEEKSTAPLLQTASRTFSGRLALQSSTVLGLERVGLVPALRMAQQLLAAQTCDRVLVAAVDSYLDPLTLDWLAGARRLKLEDRPTGLSPGEAAACLLIESDSAARQRSAPTLFHIRGMAEAQDAPIQSDPPNVGRGLAEAMTRCLDEAGLAEPFTGNVISDHNGEEWRAVEYGGARALLAARLPGAAPDIYPALSLGEVGAASTAVALCVAGRSFARRYAAADAALVVGSTELGQSVALVAASQ